jgi:hypothetical protein
MEISLADRLKQLPPYLFAKIDQMKQEVLRKGVDVIDLGVGDPDLPTPQSVIEKLKQTAEDPPNHRYPSYEGMVTFRQAVADWYKLRFGVAPRKALPIFLWPLSTPGIRSLCPVPVIRYMGMQLFLQGELLIPCLCCVKTAFCPTLREYPVIFLEKRV